MVDIKQLYDFFKSPKIAVVGASRNKNKFGYMIYTKLKKYGYSVIPINPYADFIDGDICLKDISELNPKDTALVLVTHREQTDAIMDKAISLGFKQIWVQTDCETDKTPFYAQNKVLNVIFNFCILVVMRPKSEEVLT